MNDASNIGVKIKELRNERKLTLKQLSEKTNLSIGFLSQLERGLTTIAIDSLSIIASVLDVELTSFFEPKHKHKEIDVIHTYEKPHNIINPFLIQYTLSQNIEEFDFLPREFHLMPASNDEEMDQAIYSHEGQEFIYVLEGVLTITVKDQEFVLYPTESIIIHSNVPHNWQNRTNKIVKFLQINSPNPFKSDQTKHSYF